jgi:hypothetical protein
MASIQTDNLIGDLERLRGAIEVALIEGGSSANGALRGMTQWITKAGQRLQRSAARTAAGRHRVHRHRRRRGPGRAGVLLLLPRIAATRAALAAMGVTAARARTR